MKCDNVSKLKGKHFVFNLGHAHWSLYFYI
jgi:hypothetical protein